MPIILVKIVVIPWPTDAIVADRTRDCKDRDDDDRESGLSEQVQMQAGVHGDDLGLAALVTEDVVPAVGLAERPGAVDGETEQAGEHGAENSDQNNVSKPAARKWASWVNA